MSKNQEPAAIDLNRMKQDIIKQFENELERNVVERMLSQFESISDILEQNFSQIKEQQNQILKGQTYVDKYLELKNQLDEKEMIIAKQREEIEALKISL